VNVTLDGEYAARLARLAERAHTEREMLASSLLSRAIDEAEADPDNVEEVLNGISGAFERAKHGLEQAHSGRTVPLDLLVPPD
jgi:predicted transcriptional regulator